MLLSQEFALAGKILLEIIAYLRTLSNLRNLDAKEIIQCFAYLNSIAKITMCVFLRKMLQ